MQPDFLKLRPVPSTSTHLNFRSLQALSIDIKIIQIPLIWKRPEIFETRRSSLKLNWSHNTPVRSDNTRNTRTLTHIHSFIELLADWSPRPLAVMNWGKPIVACCYLFTPVDTIGMCAIQGRMNGPLLPLLSCKVLLIRFLSVAQIFCRSSRKWWCRFFSSHQIRYFFFQQNHSIIGGHSSLLGRRRFQALPLGIFL